MSFIKQDKLYSCKYNNEAVCKTSFSILCIKQAIKDTKHEHLSYFLCFLIKTGDREYNFSYTDEKQLCNNTGNFLCSLKAAETGEMFVPSM